MRVKLLQQWAGAHGSHNAGAIVEVPDPIGESLVAGTYAQKLEADEAAFVEQRTFSVADVCKMFNTTPDRLREKADRLEVAQAPDPTPVANPAGGPAAWTSTEEQARSNAAADATAKGKAK